MYKDLREFLLALEANGLLRRVKAKVDKNWEISSIMRWVYLGNPEEKRYAISFDAVDGYDIPVVVGAIGASYKTYGLGLGIDPNLPKSEIRWAIRKKWMAALDKPIEPKMVSWGHCKENILKGSDINTHKFPVPVWTPEKDRNWDKGFGFITSPYHVTKDPETKVRNVGTYRTMIRAERNLLGLGGRGQIATHIQKNERNGKSTEIATVIGADPAIGMASITQIPYGVDEFAVAGGLRGSPVELVKCETVDLEVPAAAEIVIEGRLLHPSENPTESEGPFGEYHGFQGSARFHPIYQVSCITHRNSPIYQAFISQMPPTESSKMRHLSHEALLLRGLKSMGMEGVVNVYMPETAQMGVIIVSIDKRNYGHPRRVANAVFALVQGTKFVIVTDDDIDIFDLDNLLWALTFRVSLTPARKNIQFVEGINCKGLDYSAAPSLEEANQRVDWPSIGLFIDATRPYKPYPVVSLPPKKYLERVKDAWNEYDLPPLQSLELPRSILDEEKYLQRGIVAKPAFDPPKPKSAD